MAFRVTAPRMVMVSVGVQGFEFAVAFTVSWLADIIPYVCRNAFKKCRHVCGTYEYVELDEGRKN